MSNLYKCPICGGPSNYSSINYQPKPCLHCCATLKLKPADQQHGNLFAVHDASGKTVGHFEVDEKANKELVGATAETPWAVKEGYWYGQYKLMREKYYKQMGENSQQAERIKDLTFLVTELQPNRDYADRIRELEEHSSKQDFLIDELVDSLRDMVAHCEGFISNWKEGK